MDGWIMDGGGVVSAIRMLREVGVVVGNGRGGRRTCKSSWSLSPRGSRRPPLCARNRFLPLLLSSAVLIVKDVDVVVVLRIATMGAFKGVEGINGPSVRVRGRPHLDHAATRYPYHDQAASPSAKRVELPDGRRTTIFCRAGASGVRTRTGD